jgi:hypothetical protein
MLVRERDREGVCVCVYDMCIEAAEDHFQWRAYGISSAEPSGFSSTVLVKSTAWICMYMCHSFPSVTRQTFQHVIAGYQTQSTV